MSNLSLYTTGVALGNQVKEHLTIAAEAHDALVALVNGNDLDITLRFELFEEQLMPNPEMTYLSRDEVPTFIALLLERLGPKEYCYSYEDLLTLEVEEVLEEYGEESPDELLIAQAYNSDSVNRIKEYIIQNNLNEFVVLD